MKQPLWLLNSSLLIIFFISLLTSFMLKQEAQLLPKKPILFPEIKKRKLLVPINLEKLYRQDLFDTFIPTEKIISQQSLVTPVPPPPAPSVIPPPEPKKQEFIQPLPITIKGIIFSSDESKSVAMIEDEAKKEKVYRLGSKIKDGQILKMSRNKIVILRANGQQEIFLLRKKEKQEDVVSEKWKYVIKKIDDQNYQIDPKEFVKQTTSLGQLIENLSLTTAYQQSDTIGIKIGKLDATQVGPLIGLNENDIIISLNDINTADIKNRIKIYDTITKMKKGDNIKVYLKRGGQEIILNYKLAILERPRKKMFLQPAAEGEVAAPPDGVFKMSEQQKREKIEREFEKIHKKPKHKHVISDIRRRLLENMRSRSRNRRVR